MRTIAHFAAGFVARLMVVLLVSGAAVPLVVHGAGDDPCDAPSAASSGTVISPQAQSPAPVRHCEICHFLRQLPGLDAVAPPVLPGLPVSVVVSAPLPEAFAPLTIAGVPTRAPPA
jgi:hypothetical protein